MERFFTIPELAEYLHIGDRAVRSRLNALKIKPYGHRTRTTVVNGMRHGSRESIYFLDPEKVTTGRQKMEQDGWLRTTDVSDMIGGQPDAYKVRRWLEEIGAKRRQWNNAFIWKMPPELQEKSAIRASFFAWKETQQKPTHPMAMSREDDPKWFDDVLPGETRDLVLEERRLKGMVGQTVTVKSKENGQEWEGELLSYSMVCFKLKSNGTVREFLTRKAKVIA